MAAILIYTKSTCGFCAEAKSLLRKKAVAFQEISVDNDPAGQRAMAARAHGRSTVPQIFINEQHIGGCDDLYALDAAGGLDPLLAR